MVIISATISSGKADSRTLAKIEKKMVSDFLDIIMLAQLQSGQKSGYDLIEFVREKFRVTMSSSTVYTTLYSLERYGLVDGCWDGRKRVYGLTKKGFEVVEFVCAQQAALKAFANSVLVVPGKQEAIV